MVLFKQIRVGSDRSFFMGGEHDPNEGEDRNPPLTDVSSQDGGSWQEALSLLEQARKNLQVAESRLQR